MDFIQSFMQITHRKTFFLFLCFTAVPSCRCTDEYQREIFLGPRNYNPHPYEHQLARIQDPGPVTFPFNEGDDDPNVNNKYNVVTINNKGTDNPVDDHPYAKVAEKFKYLINKKYSRDRENDIDAKVYDGLAEQGAKVLGFASDELKDFASKAQKNNNYAFAYKVLDKGSGDNFSHQQIRNSKATNGEYRVKLPDGRVQVVSYKADNDGYEADVKYEYDPEFTHQNLIQASEIQNIHQYLPQNVDVQKVPVRQLKPRSRPAVINSYDYAAEEGEQQQPNPLSDPHVLEQAGPTQIAVKYVDIGVTPSPSPSAYLPEDIGNYGLRISHHYPKVQIYTTNARDHLQGNFVSTTAATPTYGKVVRYTSTPVPPVQAQVDHAGDHGLFNPALVNSYAPPVRQSSPNYKNVITRPDASGRIGGSPYHQTLAQEDELPVGIYIVGKAEKRKK